MKNNLRIRDIMSLLLLVPLDMLGEPYGPDESDSSELSREGGPPPPIGPNSSRRRGVAADADDVTPEGEENIAG